MLNANVKLKKKHGDISCLLKDSCLIMELSRAFRGFRGVTLSYKLELPTHTLIISYHAHAGRLSHHNVRFRWRVTSRSYVLLRRL